MRIGKLDKPPYAHNWVRYVYPSTLSTTKALVRFARGRPTTSYAAGGPIIRDRIMLGLDRETARKAAATTGRANSRELVAEYVNAFFDYEEERRYAGRPCFDEVIEPFRIGKDITVPVKPLVTIVENDRLVPIFSVGWASFPLTRWQRRLLATVFEDAVFSLTDFRNSPGEFLCFPRVESDGEEVKREALVWRRGDYELLEKGELRDTLDGYLLALDAAKEILNSDTTKDQEVKAPASPSTSDYGPLFDQDSPPAEE